MEVLIEIGSPGDHLREAIKYKIHEKAEEIGKIPGEILEALGDIVANIAGYSANELIDETKEIPKLAGDLINELAHKIKNS